MALSFEQAVELEKFYRSTDPEVLRRLAGVGIAAFAGPVGAGKNFQMELSGLPVPHNKTTRTWRSGDKNYEYLSLPEMLERIDEGLLVQYAALKETRTLYGTGIEDYQEGKIHAKDILVDSIDQLHHQGFGTVRHIGVVAYSDEWEPRLDKRFASMELKDVQGRLNETEHSLRVITGEWAPRNDRLVIVSTQLHSKHNYELIHEFIETGITPGLNDEAIAVGQEMLAGLSQLRAKYLGDKS